MLGGQEFESILTDTPSELSKYSEAPRFVILNQLSLNTKIVQTKFARSVEIPSTHHTNSAEQMDIRN